MSGRFKRRSQSCCLVNYAASAPNITLLVILLIVDLFRTHVIGGADMSVGIHRVLVHHPGQPKVTKFDVLFGVEEDVAGFQIPM